MYCTQADLQRRYGDTELIDLTDTTGGGTIDSQTVESAIDDAAALIDSHLENRYRSRMPFTNVPSVLERIACALARYFLYTQDPPEAIQTHYKNAVKFLESVSAGAVSLGIDEQPPTSGGLPEIQADSPVWKRADSSGFI